LFISLQLPVGLFFPCLVIGAVSGRLFGQVVGLNFPGGIQQCTAFGCSPVPIQPWVYTVVGAASYTGAFTQTISAAVVMLELTTGFELLVPMLYVTAIAMLTSRVLIPGAYDMTVYLGKLGYIPDLNILNPIWGNHHRATHPILQGAILGINYQKFL
jgi:H+/Cl- antiporter ClcA